LRFTEKSSFSALISLLFHSVLKYISLSLYLLSFLFPSVDRGKALERQREREREREREKKNMQKPFMNIHMKRKKKK
jgi:hypothetical protein